MRATMLAYIDRPSPVHKLTGGSKLLFFLFWSLAGMITYDTRLLLTMFALGVFLFYISKVTLKDIWIVLVFIVLALALNNIALFVFSPLEGCKIFGTRHDLFHIAGRYTVTSEQLFYQFNVTLKYFTVLPVALLFLLTTNPSEFAASLNRIGVNYKIAYSVSLALRYIPDIQQSFFSVALAQQARGIDISKKEKLTKRIVNAVSIIIPLIFSSLQRIEVISNAMELRRFGKNRKRTWYAAKPTQKIDVLAVAFSVLLFVISFGLFFVNGGRFYNPFG